MAASECMARDVSEEGLSAHTLDGARPSEGWAPITVRRAEIDRYVEALADRERPAHGRRHMLLAHPSAPDPGRGLTPGVQVRIEVLLPGESTAPICHNSTMVQFCIRGGGHVEIGDTTFDFSQWDVWNHPSFVPYRFVNSTEAIQLRLSYSNAALLEMLRVHLVEEDPSKLASKAANDEAPDPRRESPFGTICLPGGAQLMPYEGLINPPAVESRALHFPWAEVSANLEKLAALGKDYVGRRLYLLHNPMTGRFNGTTPNFFATMTLRPPGIVDRPHRHVSSAINYYFSGSGFSVVDRKRYDWSAGDLMVSAPGWAVHNHASGDGEPVRELTIQDQPLHIFMESLLWQERMDGAPKVLGVGDGFETNRGEASR